MQEQDKRAVESMCRCGLDLESVISVFPSLPREEIVAIYKSVEGRDTDDVVIRYQELEKDRGITDLEITDNQREDCKMLHGIN